MVLYKKKKNKKASFSLFESVEAFTSIESDVPKMDSIPSDTFDVSLEHSMKLDEYSYIFF